MRRSVVLSVRKPRTVHRVWMGRPFVQRRHRLAEGAEADPLDLDAEHTGGTPKLALAGKTYNGGEAGRLIGDITPATVVGHENILKRMTLTKFPEASWPT